MIFRRRQLYRFQAPLASLLLRPERTARAVIVCIVLYASLRVPVLIGLRQGEDLFMDSTEAYAWGQQFLPGYGRHPPMTGWIAGLWYRFFPATNWASYTLSSVMSCVSLLSIYFIARRVLAPRRAAFIVFVMMLYPLFHIKANRFSNYQVLLAVLPLLVLIFLIAYEKRTVLAGALLGLMAATATLTIYSGFLGLLAIGIAAIVHPGRAQFFRSPAPYVAALVYLLAVSPHLIWLVRSDFVSLRYAEENLGEAALTRHPLKFLADHAVLLAMPFAGAAIALWPWRAKPAGREHPKKPDRMLVIVVTAVLIGAAPILATPLDVGLKPDWGIPLFFLVPLSVLSLLPWLLVTRRAVVFAAVIAGAWVVVLVVAASAAPWVKSKTPPLSPRHWAFSELARELTQVWRQKFNSPLPIVVGELAVASAVTFYSPDHPRMLVDFNPALSPWIDFPSELRRKGFVGVCEDNHETCLSYIESLDPAAEHADLTLSRPVEGASPIMLRFHVRVSGPPR